MHTELLAEWDGKTGEEWVAQMTATVYDGDRGYLLELEYDEPSALEILVPEAFEDNGPHISAELLRARLPAALIAVEQCQRTTHGETDADAIQELLSSYEDFVALCERKEKLTGKPCRFHLRY